MMKTVAEVHEAWAELSPEAKKQFAQVVNPSRLINDYIWLIVIGGVVIAMLIAVASFALNTGAGNNLLAVFTGTIAFIGGLFTPSPATRGD